MANHTARGSFLLYVIGMSIVACRPDTRAVLEIDLPTGMSCSDFQVSVRQSLQDLPLTQWPEEGWLTRENDEYMSLQYKNSTPASLYLVVSNKGCHLKAEWYHASANPKPTVESKEMFFRVMSALQDTFGEDAVRVTKRGHYFGR